MLMSFCPQCGAATDPSMSFCTACGRMLEKVPPPAMPAMSPAASAWGAPTRPVGKTVKPGIAVLLTVVTFTIYAIFFWWRTSRETDAATGSRAHPLVRAGIFVELAAGAILVVGVVMTAVQLLPTLADQAGSGAPLTPEDQEALVQAYTTNPVVIAGFLGVMIGSIILYAGLWRMWTAIQRDETASHQAKPINPALLMGLIVATILLQFVPYLVPALTPLSYVGFLATCFTVYVTQDHLNRMWASPAAPPAIATPGA